jgi:hypothetical protein
MTSISGEARQQSPDIGAESEVDPEAIHSLRGYSFGESFSDSDGWMALPSDNHHLGADWGRSSGHTPRSFSFSANARLPLGLFVTGTLQWNGGQAYNITTGNDDNNDGVTNDRPSGVMTSPNFGKSTSARNPRQLEVGARFNF